MCQELLGQVGKLIIPPDPISLPAFAGTYTGIRIKHVGTEMSWHCFQGFVLHRTRTQSLTLVDTNRVLEQTSLLSAEPYLPAWQFQRLLTHFANPT